MARIDVVGSIPMHCCTSPGTLYSRMTVRLSPQAARLSLHHEHPECVAGLPHQGAPCLLRRCRRARVGGIELAEPRESLFQRSPHPSERRGLLLGDLIVENVDGRAMKAKVAGHEPCIAPEGSHAQRCAVLQACSGFVVPRLSAGQLRY